MGGQGTVSPVSGPEGEANPSSRTPRACDNCFKKKVKCDKKSPCSSCRASNIPCSTAPKRPKERRQRVLISSQYERKIDLLDERLAGIEASLRTLLSGTPTSESSRKASFWSARGLEDDEDSDSTEPDSDSSRSRSATVFEGDSALSAHTTRIGQAFEETLHQQTITEPTPEMTAAFTSLRALLNAQRLPLTRHDLRFPGQKEKLRCCPFDCELPPTAAVLALLKAIKEEPPCCFVKFPIVSVAEFTEMCQKVFFPTENYSLATYTLVNGGLYYCYLERMLTIDSPTIKAEYKQYADLCRSNFESGLSNFPLLTQPTCENVQTLLLGAVHATKLSRPSMCWMFITTAAQISVTLGWHRISPAQDRLGTKTRLFWFIYIIDQGFALKLGRPPNIPAYDVTVEIPPPTTDPGRRPWETLHAYWAETALIQERMYRDLYSASATREGPEVRAAKAMKLASELQFLKDNFYKRPYVVKGALYESYLTFELEFDEVAYYALLTLIRQAIPPARSGPGSGTAYSQECVDTARKCLEVHRELFNRFGHDVEGLWRGYIEWCLLYQPFTPYLVIFCQAVTTLDLGDLESLQDVMASLQAASQLSEGAARLHQVCSVLFRVAKVYIEEKLSRSDVAPLGPPILNGEADGQIPLLSGFDFGSFGMPNPVQGFVGQAEASADYIMPGGLGGWMPTEQDMMGFLDTDMSSFDML